MRRMVLVCLCAVLINLSPLFGQSSLTLVGSVPGFSVPLGFAPAPNYSAVNRISLAPGQIVTLQVTGLKTVLPSRADYPSNDTSSTHDTVRYLGNDQPSSAGRY